MKEKVKKFYEENKKLILATAAITGVTVATILWMLYVKRNTVDLPKLNLSDGKVLQNYTQFGEHVMNAVIPAKDAATFIGNVLNGQKAFSEKADVFIMFTEDI